MNEIEVNALITRAQKLIGGEMPVTIISNQKTLTVGCKFVEISKPHFVGESGSSNNWEITGMLEAPDGYRFPKSLKQIVTYLESKKG